MVAGLPQPMEDRELLATKPARPESKLPIRALHPVKQNS